MTISGIVQRTRILITPSLLLMAFGFLMPANSQTTVQPKSQNSRAATASLFAYRPVPFDLKEESSKQQIGAIIRDITYAGYTPQRGRIRAYLVQPAEVVGPFAGVVFFHWYGKPNGDRTEFLDEAVALARQGTVSLLIQGFFPWAVAPANAQSDRRLVIDETVEVRRALDLLLSQPQVDQKRIAFVGHDYGAMYGAIVSGVEKRVKAYVLMTGIGSLSDWSLKYWPVTAARGEDIYRQVLREIEPITLVSQANPAALLFQFSNNDKYISKAAATAFSDAASKPKEVKWYDAEHELNEAARIDRREWLTRQLHLAKPPKS